MRHLVVGVRLLLKATDGGRGEKGGGRSRRARLEKEKIERFQRDGRQRCIRVLPTAVEFPRVVSLFVVVVGWGRFARIRSPEEDNVTVEQMGFWLRYKTALIR
jgi:hypothetical protein